MTDNTELKRLAEASLGDWYEVGELRCEDRSGYINGLHHDDEYFIAAANPAAVLALIAENERLESERADLWRGKRDAEATRDTKSAVIAELKAEIAGLRTGYEAYERVNAELKADNEALRKERDARHPFKPFHEPSIGYTGCVICGVFTDHGGLPCPKTRATADAALGQGEQS